MKKLLVLLFLYTLICLCLNINSENAFSDSQYSVGELTDYFKFNDKIEGKAINCSIAILDTGSSLSAVTKANLLTFQDFVNYRDIPYDDNGHGSEICSILFGIEHEKNNYEGICSSLDYIVLKVADKNGQIAYIDFLNSLEWLSENFERYNIKVVCMPLSFPTLYDDDLLLITKINELVTKGVYIVTSSGNEGENMRTAFPGNLPCVISVGSLDYNPKNEISRNDLYERNTKQWLFPIIG